MFRRVQSSFVVDARRTSTEIVPGGLRFERSTIARSFTGAIRGTGACEAIAISGSSADVAPLYLAIEDLHVCFHGRQGGFCLVGISGGPGRRMPLRIVPGSGQGDFEGIQGVAELLDEDTLLLVYRTDDGPKPELRPEP